MTSAHGDLKTVCWNSDHHS